MHSRRRSIPNILLLPAAAVLITLLFCTKDSPPAPTSDVPDGIELTVVQDTTVGYFDTLLTLTGQVSWSDTRPVLLLDGDTVALGDTDSFTLHLPLDFNGGDSLRFRLEASLDEGLSPTYWIVVRRMPLVTSGKAGLSGLLYATTACGGTSLWDLDAGDLIDSAMVTFDNLALGAVDTTIRVPGAWRVEIEPGTYRILVSAAEND